MDQFLKSISNVTASICKMDLPGEWDLYSEDELNLTLGLQEPWPGNKPISTWLDRLLHQIVFGVLSTVSHLLLIGITLALSKKCFELRLEKTAAHAYYCTLAFVLLMGESIIFRSNYDLIVNPLHIQIKDAVHVALSLSGFCMGVYGVALKYFQKNERQNETGRCVLHFRSTHGFYGILGPILFLLALIIGFAALTDQTVVQRSTIISIHRAVGLLTFVLLMISQYYGYNTGFSRRNLSARSIKLYKFFTFLAAITTIYYPFRKVVFDIIEAVPAEWLAILGTVKKNT